MYQSKLNSVGLNYIFLDKIQNVPEFQKAMGGLFLLSNCDIGLRYYLLGTKPADVGHILENVIYLGLLRREEEVYVGKCGESEIDFVTVTAGEKKYYQVAYTVINSDESSSTLERKIKPLLSVKDSFSKYLITMDNVPNATHDGIKQVYALDWLLEKVGE